MLATRKTLHDANKNQGYIYRHWYAMPNHVLGDECHKHFTVSSVSVREVDLSKIEVKLKWFPVNS